MLLASTTGGVDSVKTSSRVTVVDSAAAMGDGRCVAVDACRSSAVRGSAGRSQPWFAVNAEDDATGHDAPNGATLTWAGLLAAILERAPSVGSVVFVGCAAPDKALRGAKLDDDSSGVRRSAERRAGRQVGDHPTAKDGGSHCKAVPSIGGKELVHAAEPANASDSTAVSGQPFCSGAEASEAVVGREPVGVSASVHGGEHRGGQDELDTHRALQHLSRVRATALASLGPLTLGYRRTTIALGLMAPEPVGGPRWRMGWRMARQCGVPSSIKKARYWLMSRVSKRLARHVDEGRSQASSVGAPGSSATAQRGRDDLDEGSAAAACKRGAVIASPDAWPLESGSAQIIVVLGEVTRTLRRPEAFDELCRVLAPGGYVLWVGPRRQFPGVSSARSLPRHQSGYSVVHTTCDWRLHRCEAWSWWGRRSPLAGPRNEQRSSARWERGTSSISESGYGAEFTGRAGSGPAPGRQLTARIGLGLTSWSALWRGFDARLAQLCPDRARGQACSWQRIDTQVLRLGPRRSVRRRGWAPGVALARDGQAARGASSSRCVKR